MEPDVLDEASTEVAPSVLQTSAGANLLDGAIAVAAAGLRCDDKVPLLAAAIPWPSTVPVEARRPRTKSRRNILAVLLLQPVRVLNLASTAEASVPRMPSRIWMSSWRNPYGLLECRHDRTCPTYWVRISDSDISLNDDESSCIRGG